MDIVEFAESLLGYRLLLWQKELLRRVDQMPKDQKLVYCLGRRRWAIAKESDLSSTSLVPHDGLHTRICIVDETVHDEKNEGKL